MSSDEEFALVVENLHKTFRLPHDRKNSLKSRLINFGSRQTYETFHVLNNINFSVKKGEFFGIVGRNGSGKSTLLKTIGKIYYPTSGKVQVNGTLTPFIELGIGFNAELTGRENVFLNGAILGLTRKETEEKYDEIVGFAELEKFMDQKLKNYSSGMQVRLAFAIAIQAHNDIMLIDEVLAVGDSSFQRKCFEVFRQIKNSDKTVILVTHDMGVVQEFCDRALMIQDSKVIAMGKPREIALRYELANSPDATTKDVTTLERPKDPAIKITNFRLLSGDRPSQRYSIDDKITAEIEIEVRKPTEVQINFFFLKADGAYMAGINSTNEFGAGYKPTKGTHLLRCEIDPGQLTKGEYGVGVGVYTPGYVPEIIDVIDKNYDTKMPSVTIVDKSLYKDGDFYLQGKWSKA